MQIQIYKSCNPTNTRVDLSLTASTELTFVPGILDTVNKLTLSTVTTTIGAQDGTLTVKLVPKTNLVKNGIIYLTMPRVFSILPTYTGSNFCHIESDGNLQVVSTCAS